MPSKQAMFYGDVLSSRFSDEDRCKLAEDDWGRSESHFSTLFDDMRSDLEKFWLITNTSNIPTVGEQASPEPDPVGGYSKLKIGTARNLIEVYVALVMSNLFAGNDGEWLKVIPRNILITEDAQKRMTLAELFKQYRLYMLGPDQMRFYDKFEGFVLQKALFYWSTCFVGWKHEPGWVHDPHSFVGNPDDVSVENILSDKEIKPGYDQNIGHRHDPYAIWRPDLFVPHTFNTRPDPRGGPDFTDCAFFMDELRLPWEVLRTNEWDKKKNPHGLYYNLDKLEDIVEGDDSAKTSEEKLRTDIGDVDAGGALGDEKDKKTQSFRQTVILRRYWTSKGYFITDQKLKVVIARRRTPGWILYSDRYSRDPHKFEGQSALRVLRCYDEEIDTLTNLDLDNVNAAVNAVKVIQKAMISSNSKGKHLTPGVEIDVVGDAREAITLMPNTYVPNDAMARIGMVKDEASLAMHLNEPQKGEFFQGGLRKATEHQIVEKYAQSYFNIGLRRTNDGVLKPVLRDISELEYFYASAPIREKEEGIYTSMFKGSKEDVDYLTELMSVFSHDPLQAYAFVEMTPQMIIENILGMDFLPVGSDFIQGEAERRGGVMKAVEGTMSNPILAQIGDPVAIFLEIWRTVGGIRDPERMMGEDGRDRFSYTPEDEWILMQAGAERKTHRLDDHAKHLKVHIIQQLAARTMRISDTVKSLLDQHIEDTQERLVALTTTNPTGIMTEAPTQGQEGSQMTLGAQGANMGNIQPRGVTPQSADVTKPTEQGAMR